MTTAFSASLTKSQKEWRDQKLISREGQLADGEWVLAGRADQRPPETVADTWLVTGGRGSGKTRLGAEWVNCLVWAFRPLASSKHGKIALVGETLADVREVMIEGPSGIVTVSRGRHRPRYEPSRRRLIWPNGAVAYAFSAEDPESLRGPQFAAAWSDELGKWKNAEACFDMLQFGLRLGERPVQLITTTPRPTRLMKKLYADPHVTQTRLSTEANAANLAAGFVEAVRRKYEGTRLGRQELDGELIEDRDDALWSRDAIAAARVAGPPEMRRIVVAVDPPASAQRTSDACGIVAAGLDENGIVHVLADATVRGAKPHEWAASAIALFYHLDADAIVAEVNQGGDMVTSVIRTVDATVPVKPVRARRGKWLRAEPVAALYQQGRVVHAGHFPLLEDEMCDFSANGLSDGRSPDRVDALVWAVTELLPGTSAEPRVRDFQ